MILSFFTIAIVTPILLPQALATVLIILDTVQSKNLKKQHALGQVQKIRCRLLISDVRR